MVVSPGIPPGASPALGLSPCQSVRYAAFVSGVGLGCRPRPWDGRSAPGAPTSWTGSNALTAPGRPRTVPSETVIRPLTPDAKVRDRAPRGSPAPSRCCRAAALAGLVLLIGYAQQDLQLLGAAPGGQDLCGRLQPAQHDHGQDWSGRVQLAKARTRQLMWVQGRRDGAR